jgi:hypothetical protein
MMRAKLVTAAILSLLLATPSAFAFHDGGVAECAGCHTMHNSQDGALVTDAGGHAYLLKAANSTDACLELSRGVRPVPAAARATARAATSIG